MMFQLVHPNRRSQALDVHLQSIPMWLEALRPVDRTTGQEGGSFCDPVILQRLRRVLLEYRREVVNVISRRCRTRGVTGPAGGSCLEHSQLKNI
jgi:hypothetical protein